MSCQHPLEGPHEQDSSASTFGATPQVGKTTHDRCGSRADLCPDSSQARSNQSAVFPSPINSNLRPLHHASPCIPRSHQPIRCQRRSHLTSLQELYLLVRHRLCHVMVPAQPPAGCRLRRGPGQSRRWQRRSSPPAHACSQDMGTATSCGFSPPERRGIPMTLLLGRPDDAPSAWRALRRFNARYCPLCVCPCGFSCAILVPQQEGVAFADHNLSLCWRPAFHLHLWTVNPF